MKNVLTKHGFSKASSYDCIHVVALRNCEPELLYLLLAYLSNMCLDKCCVSDSWKVSSLVRVRMLGYE